MSLITVHQAANRTGLRMSQIIAAIRKNALPAKLLGAKTNKGYKPLWHIEESDLTKFMESLQPNDYRTYLPAEVRDNYLEKSKKNSIIVSSKDIEIHKKLEQISDSRYEKELTKEIWEGG